MNKKKILISYFSVTGNTKKMAEIIADNIDTNFYDVILKNCLETTKDDMINVDCILIGTPTYYGLPAKEIIQLITERVRPHGLLEGKIGGAFSSSGNIAGGNETAILAILKAMLVHGMIIQGVTKGDHYGPVSINTPDDRAKKYCEDFAKRTEKLLKNFTKI
jgi:NAD(P)H dehydrogenase (quinone)